MPPHEEGAIASLFDGYVSFGGYPPVVLSTDAEQKLQMLHEIFDTVIQRDKIERHRIRYTATFKVFINSLLSSVGRKAIFCEKGGEVGRVSGHEDW
jgi:predicted AAA+ superfamily ATPase